MNLVSLVSIRGNTIEAMKCARVLFIRPYFVDLQYFINSIVNYQTPAPSADDGPKAIEAISLAYENQIS